MKKTLIILAAGIGSRFGGIKQLAKIGPRGEMLLELTIQDAIEAGFDAVIHVIRGDIESDYRSLVADKFAQVIETHIKYQEIDEGRVKPWGVAQALLAALPITGVCAVVNADDYYGNVAMKQMSLLLEECNASTFGMIGYILNNTLSENGSVNRGVCSVEDGLLLSIEETKGIRQINNQLIDSSGNTIDEEATVSMNFWAFHSDTLSSLSDFVARFKQINLNDSSAELPLPPYVDYLITCGVACKVVPAQDQRIGITYKEDIELAKKMLNDRYEISSLLK